MVFMWIISSPSALCFLLFFFFFFLWFSTVAASAVCCSLAMKVSMSSKQWLRIPWKKRELVVWAARRWIATKRWMKKPKTVCEDDDDEEAYHFSLRSQERYIRSTVHTVCCCEREESIQFIHFHSRPWSCNWNSCPPFTPETHPLTHTNTQCIPCAPEILLP